MTLPRVITEELGGSALAMAAQRNALPDWYPRRPGTAEEWRAYLREVASNARPNWLGELASAIDAKSESASRLARVERNGGIVISTGQQAALFGGPLYTLVKAIGALGLADALEKATGVPAVVVFWAATDDADYDEARWAGVVANGGLRTLTLPPSPRVGIPMNEMPLSDIAPLVDALADACGSVSDPEPLETVRNAYASGATLGGAYVRHLRALFEPLGIAVLDASHPAVRRAAAPVLTDALTGAPEIERKLRQRSAAILDRGFRPQVEHLPQLSLVFATDQNGEKGRIPVAEAEEFLRTHPVDRLSPNVLLRPIVERFLMPSAAYLAGPGELAYFAQVSAAAEALGRSRPLPVARWSATLLEPRIERLMNRLGVDREDLRQREAVETRLARLKLPDDLREALRRLRSDLEADVAALERSDRDGLVPSASVQGLRRSLLHRLERTERRYVAALKRRESELMRDIATVAAALYPNGTRQERVLNFVPFLARYGGALIDAMRVEARRHATSIVEPSALDVNAPVPERV